MDIRDVPVDERVTMTTFSFFFLLLSSLEFFTIIVTALCIKIERFFLLPSFFCAFYNIHFADKKNAAH